MSRVKQYRNPQRPTWDPGCGKHSAARNWLPHFGQQAALPFLFFLFFCAQLNAQSNAVAAFDSGYVETGNPFWLHIYAPDQYGQPLQVDFSNWDTLLPSENILYRSDWRREANGWAQDLKLILFDSAHLSLPPLDIALQNGERLQTNALELEVLPTPSSDDPADLQDIKSIHLEPVSWRDYIRPYLPIVVGVLLFAFVVWWLLLRRKKSGLKAIRTIQQAPHELAFRRLAELERRQYWQNGQLKTYYSELTHIVREYLEQRFHILALESASEEIIHALLQKTDMPAPLLAPLSELLRWADLAKFAKGAPPEHFHGQAMREVRQMIEQTIPTPVDDHQPDTSTPHAR